MLSFHWFALGDVCFLPYFDWLYANYQAFCQPGVWKVESWACYDNNLCKLSLESKLSKHML